MLQTITEFTFLGPHSLILSGSNHWDQADDLCDRQLFLSREACVALGIIPKTSPEVSTTCNAIETPKHEGNNNGSKIDCEYPARQKPPPPPKHLPFPATEANWNRLQDYLLAYYKSSTFNTGENQTLPLMERLAMKLMVDADASPNAYHTSIQAPLH